MVNAVDAKLEVQVRPGGPAGLADGANVLSLGHVLAALHVDLAQVRVNGFVALAVLDKYHIAEAVLHAGKFHYAVSDRPDRRTDR